MHQIESFFWGIVAALGALVVQLIAYIGFSAYANNPNLTFPQLFAIPTFLIVGVVIEESFKYLIISKRVELYSQDRSYLINSFFVGLGFFATELLLIFSSTANIQTKSLFEIAIIHLGSAGLIGYVVATRNPRKISTFLLALMVATFFHGAYNLLLLTERNFIVNGVTISLLTVLALLNFSNLIFINKRLAQD
ncbi:MAG: PrsW family glutamic-type intramembrane protease [Candidatus Moranbacteria bacterium]|nr:PrsW family glutamic-type intramembrane protease [Candidatus Moranbacteria bacterium]